jgi:hypothetical protein
MEAYIEFKGKLYPATDWFESSIDSKAYVFASPDDPRIIAAE